MPIRPKKGDDYGISRSAGFLITAGSAVVGSLGGPLLLVQFGGSSLLAPDRFTGTEAAEVIRRLEVVEAHLVDHPDVQLRADIAALREELAGNKARQEMILENQNRLWNRLDNR